MEPVDTRHFKPSHFQEIGGVKIIKTLPLQIIHEPIKIIIEAQQPRPEDTPKTAFTISSLYTSLIINLINSFPKAEIIFIKPQTWQAFIRKESDAVFPTSKETSIHFARKHLGERQLIPRGCKKPHDGIADAFCLGYYYTNKKV